LFAPDCCETVPRQLFGAPATLTVLKPVFEFIADRALDRFGVDPELASRLKAVAAEAHAE
jgi:hypothetical protein